MPHRGTCSPVSRPASTETPARTVAADIGLGLRDPREVPSMDIPSPPAKVMTGLKDFTEPGGAQHETAGVAGWRLTARPAMGGRPGRCGNGGRGPPARVLAPRGPGPPALPPVGEKRMFSPRLEKLLNGSFSS